MKKIISIILSLVFVAAGIVVIVIGVKQNSESKQYELTGKATIASIERTWTGTDDEGFDTYEYTVRVDYEIDGKEYKNVEYPYYSDSMHKGDEVEFLYNADDPTKIVEKNAGGHSLIIIVFGAVFAVIGLVATVKTILTGRTA